jgi:hypothetical protein
MTRIFVIATRLLFSLLTLAALAAQLAVHIRSGFNVVNYFSYFTNLSNLFAGVVMLRSAIHLIQRRDPTPMDDLVRGSSTAGMVIVGIVFNVLLRNEDLGSLMPWVNVVVHYIMPIAALLDWLFVPPKATLAFGRIQYWLVFPLSYLAYLLLRGAMIDWYPYPFLNPANVGGYGGVTLYTVGILTLFLVVSLVLVGLGNTLRRSFMVSLVM